MTTEEYKIKFNEFLSELQVSLENIPEVKSVTGNFSSFAPHIQFVKIDFLNKEDWPNNISENSIYLKFIIDFDQNIVKLYQCGHIYLTKNDQKASFLVMGSMKTYTQAYSEGMSKVSWLRSFTMNNFKHGVEKIAKFVKNEVDVLNWATAGYPYKKAIVNIYK